MPHRFTLTKGGIPMEDYEEMVSTRLGQPPPSRRRGRRWLLIGGFAFALMLALGVGAIMGSSVSTTQAASVTSGNANSAQTLTFAQGGDNSAQALAAPPRAHGPCEAMTVSSVNGNTIVAKTSSGSTVTIHTTASTSFRQAGKTVTASAVTVGARIH